MSGRLRHEVATPEMLDFSGRQYGRLVVWSDSRLLGSSAGLVCSSGRGWELMVVGGSGIVFATILRP